MTNYNGKLCQNGDCRGDAVEQTEAVITHDCNGNEIKNPITVRIYLCQGCVNSIFKWGSFSIESSALNDALVDRAMDDADPNWRLKSAESMAQEVDKQILKELEETIDAISPKTKG